MHINKEFPLLGLFQLLRDHGLPLGVNEYVAALHALRAGFGIEDLDSLEQICSALWVKSSDERRLLKKLLKSTFAQPVTPNLHSPDSVSLMKALEHTKRDEPTLQSLPQLDEPIQVVKAVRHKRLSQPQKVGLRFTLLTEYFPVTSRQMKQSWRYLRRPVREGPLEEIDVIATLDKMSREGILLEPILIPRRRNRGELILIVDQDGSMVPFHGLSRQLIETACRGGRFGRIGVYYFHDYPEEFFFHDPARLDAMQISQVLTEISEHAAVLIVSDAGAARGHFDKERIERTYLFIQQLSQTVRRYAWLNPMPQTRWHDTTAEEIASFVPMFEMTRSGLVTSISLLRGLYPYRKTIF